MTINSIDKRMVAVLSDVHLMDGTCYARPPNLQDAVTLLYKARKLASESELKWIDLVLLGDTLDLLRSDIWAQEGVSPAKWNRLDNKEKIIGRILSGIARNTDNEPFFACLRDLREENDNRQARLRFVMIIPGNHDRHIGQLPGHFGDHLRKMFGECEVVTEDIDTRFEDLCLLVTHGHQWDPWNRLWRRKERLVRPCPYGDFIVEDLVNRFPREFANTLKIGLNDSVVRRFQSFEHVPRHLIPLWIECCAEEELLANRKFIWRSWKRTARAFLRPNEPWERSRKPRYYFKKRVLSGNEAVELTLLRSKLRWLFLCLRMPVWAYRRIHWLARLLTCVWQKIETREDSRLQKLARFRLIDESNSKAQSVGFRFFVSGHTHRAIQVSLINSGGIERFYVNTGSWHPQISPTWDGNSSPRWSERYCGLLAMFWRDPKSKNVVMKVLKNDSFNRPEPIIERY